MSTNPPAVTPPQHDAAQNGDASVSNGTISHPRHPLHPLGPAPAADGPHGSVWPALFGWLCVIGIGVGGWYYRAPLMPYLEPLLPRSKAAPEKKTRVVPVTTASVRQRDMPLYLNGLGTVTAFKTVTLRSRVEGELIKVAFTEGQMVEEGDLLAEIDPRQFQVLLEQAEGNLARDQAILKTARTTLNRYEGLLASKSIAAQQVDDQATLVQQTVAAIQTDEATIANARLQLTYCRITAPISGRIGLRLVDQGNIVRANDPMGMAVITQLQPIAVVFTIPQDDIGRVQQRLLAKATLKVDAFDRDFKMKLATGKLLAIDNQVDATTGTLRLKAEFSNEDGMLFPNQFVNARLLVDTRQDAIVVPSAAVQRGPASMYVYVVKDDDTVEMRNVVPGPAEGGETCIENGVQVGETVVTDGLDKLQPGAKIAPRDPSKEGKEGKGQGGKPPGPSGKQDGQQVRPEKKGEPESHRDKKARDSASETTTPPSSTRPQETPQTAAQHPASGPVESSPAAESKPKAACGDSDPDPESEETRGKNAP